jgi:hypothetical protein
MGEWRNGRMEEWKDGFRSAWKSEGITNVECRMLNVEGGRMEEWKNGRMEGIAMRFKYKVESLK